MKDRLREILNDFRWSILAFFATWLVGSMIFLFEGKLVGEGPTFAHSDMINQMIPIIKMFLRQLFIERNIIFSFNNGLGMGTIPAYTNGSCFSLFNLIFLLPLDVNLQAFLLVMSKLSFAAFCFNEMNKRVLKRNDSLSVALSVSYALCAFNVAYYFVVIWQDGIYLLPIICILIDGLLKKKKNAWLIIAYSLLFIYNFYSGYVIGIYTFIIFVLYLLFMSNEEKRIKVSIFLRYILYVLLAVMISSVVLLPTAVAIIKNTPEDAIMFEGNVVNLLELFKQFYIGQSYDETGYYPYVYSGLFSLFLLPVFFVSKNISKKLKVVFAIVLLFLTVCSVTPMGYMFIHAFNNPDNVGNRGAFLYSFTLLFMAGYLCDSIKKIKKNWVIINGGIIAGYYILSLVLMKTLSNGNRDVDGVTIIAINLTIIILYVLALVYLNKNKYFIAILSVLMIIECFINGYLYKDMYGEFTYEYRNHFDYFYEEEKSIIDSLNMQDDVVRVYMPDTLIFNNPQMLGYNGVNTFSSILNQNIIKVFRKLGYRTNYLAISDNGSTPMMRVILGQNYCVSVNDLSTILNPVECGYYKVDSLPIAYMTSLDICDYSTKDCDNPFINQNDLVSAMCGENIEYYYNTGSNVIVDKFNMYLDKGEIEGKEVVGFELVDKTIQEGYIEFLDKKKESKYAYLDMLDSYAYMDSPIISTDLELYRLSFEDNALSEPRIVEMKETDEGTLVYVIMDEKTVDTYYYKMAYFYGVREEELQKAYEILSNGKMDVEEFKDGYVSGYVTSDENMSVLFTTIPYEMGWQVYVDGVKSETLDLVDGTFLGTIIPKGEHYVELKYSDKWLNVGLWIAAVGIIGTLCVFYSENIAKCKGVGNVAYSEKK